MPNNKELKEMIVAEADKIGVDVPDVSGKSNDELSAMWQELTIPAPPKIDEDDEDDEIVFPYSVAPGKSITCKKGVLADGHEMKAEWIHGGQESLNKLVKKKYVIKA